MQRESRTGWYRDVDEYGRECAVSPEGRWMHIFDAERWLEEVAQDLNLTSPTERKQPERKKMTNRQSNRGNRGRTRDSNDPTEKQLALIEKLGGDAGSVFTKEEASEYIDELAPPATDRQLDFIYDELGYDGEEPKNKFEASRLIDKLIEERDAA